MCGKSVIVDGIQRLLEQAPVTLALASRPFKIVISLLDKPEIGEAIIESVLVYIFYAIQESKDGQYPYSREVCAAPPLCGRARERETDTKDS